MSVFMNGYKISNKKHVVFMFSKNMRIYIYIYIYTCMSVCMCMYVQSYHLYLSIFTDIFVRIAIIL